MIIKYAGPRPTISHHGISFKEGKEDKYVYLMIGIQILQAIDKNYKDNKSYSYDLETKRVLDDEMLTVMQHYEPTLENIVSEEATSYEEHLTQEIDQIKQRTNLKDIEKQVWVNNLEIMKNYRIQRAINKIYYMHCIKNIEIIIKRERIKEIDTPFYEKYWHVLQTLQGNIEEGKNSIHTDLQIESTENKTITAKLLIRY